MFTCECFLSIWKFLHLVDELDPALDNHDKLYKVRPLLNLDVPQFYVPTENLSLDEDMIPAKNRLGIRQNIKSKPVKWGLKTLLCQSRMGYILDVEPYTGKADGLYVPEIGVTGECCCTKTMSICGQQYKYS